MPRLRAGELLIAVYNLGELIIAVYNSGELIIAGYNSGEVIIAVYKLGGKRCNACCTGTRARLCGC